MHDDTQIWDVMWHFCLQRPILRLTKASRHLNRFWLKYMQSCEGRMTLTRRFGLGTCQGMTEQAWLASHSQFQVALNLSPKEMKQIGMPRPNPNSRECTQLLQDLEKVQTEATKSSHIKILSRKVYMVAKDSLILQKISFWQFIFGMAWSKASHGCKTALSTKACKSGLAQNAACESHNASRESGLLEQILDRVWTML